jgi:hypothetical protein
MRRQRLSHKGPRVMKKCIKKGFSMATFAVAYSIILAGLYATAISYMVSARKADDNKH